MFDKLVDFLIGFVDLFKIGVTIDQYEQGVVLRFGKFQRIMAPGFHWLWPFGIDRVLNDTVVTRTSGGSAQTLQTKDGKTVMVAEMIRWRIVDIKKAMLEVENMDNAIRDVTYARVAEVIQQHTWDEIRAPDFADVLTKACRKAGWRYGIEVEEARIIDLAPTKVLTLSNNK